DSFDAPVAPRSQVHFKVVMGERGPMATDVQVLRDSAPSQTEGGWNGGGMKGSGASCGSHGTAFSTGKGGYDRWGSGASDGKGVGFGGRGGKGSWGYGKGMDGGGGKGGNWVMARA
ncbi:unnamed protein product, partial [Polarella glacialis]